MAGITKPEKKKESWGLIQIDKASKDHYKRIKNKYLINNPKLRSIIWKKKN